MKRTGTIYKQIAAWCGIFELKPGEKTATQELLDDRAWEIQHDEEKYRRWDARLNRRRIR